MAHNLSTFVDANGATRQCLMSLRENPWHQLGQIVEQPVGSPDAIKLAGSIQIIDAQHAAILHFVLGDYPVPDVFAKVDMAAAA